MKDFLKKNINLIIAIFIMFQPFLDLLTGLWVHLFSFNLTLGIIIKILFLLFIMYVTLFIFKQKKVLIPYLFIGIYFILYIINILIFKSGQNLFGEIQGLIKCFYFPLLLCSLYYLKDNIKISKMTLVTTLFIYLTCIFVPLIFNVGYKTYEITKAGTLGFYNSANEISGIISILTPLMILIFTQKNSSLFKMILGIVYLIVILTVGTKTPLLSLAITIFFAILYLWIKSIKKHFYKPIIISLLFFIIATTFLVLIIPTTNFYKNIETHLDYLELDNITEVFTDEKLVDHFIFSQRLTFLKKKAAIYKKSPLYQKLTGIGYYKKTKEIKMIEMDYFDIYFSHGLIGFLVVFSILIIYLAKLYKLKGTLTFTNYMLGISCLLIIFLSFFTGHIITAPSVSLIATIIILSLAPRPKKDLLFTGVNMKIGGIEKAQLNLLNKINYNKYNVVLLLEEKTGILLKDLSKNILVRELKVSENKNIIFRKFINFYRKLIFTIFNYHNYDFSCCYTTYSYSSNKLARLASLNNSIYIHSNYEHLYTKDKYLEFFNSRSISSFHHIIFVSAEAAAYFTKLYPTLKEKIKVFNNFVDIKQLILKSKEHIPLKHPSNKKLLVFVGRLDDSAKKLQRAINIAKNIKNIELWIIGSGPDEKNYKSYVQSNKINNVKFLGEQANPYPYMSIADYLILTSEYEGFPVVYLEGIVLNKPFITTIDVSDDYINIGKDYAYIIPKDETKLKIKIEKILSLTPKKININLDSIQTKRLAALEKIFDEVI